MALRDRIEYYTGDIDSWNGQVYSSAEGNAERVLVNGVQFVIDLVAKATPDKLALFTTSTSSDWASYKFTLGGDYSDYFTNVYLTHSDGKIYECTPISADMARQALDEDSLHYAPSVSPVYYVKNSQVNVLPAQGTPSIDVAKPVQTNEFDITSDGDIPRFPKSYRDIVVLFAAGKIIGSKLAYYQDYYTITETASHAYTALNTAKTELSETQALCDSINTQTGNAVTEVAKAVAEAGEMITQTDNSSDFSTALTAMNTAVDKFRADASDPALFGDESQYTTGTGITGVQNALTKAENLIDGTTMGGDTEPESVQYWLNQEDSEMAQATLQAAQSEISRAQGHIAEWNAAVGALQAEINGFATEVQSRTALTGAKSQTVQAILSEVQGYLNAAQGYSSEIQAKISISNGYIAEFNARFTKDTTTYQWLAGQKQLINTELMQALAAKGLAGAPAQ